MPLSEHEQRLLEQMERQLYADDPKLASTLRSGGSHRRGRRALALGILLVIAGLGILVAGVAAPLWPLGVLGFVVMLLGGWLAIGSWSGGSTSTSAPAPSKGSAPKQRSSFMTRLEERWDRRRDGQN